MIKYFKFLSKSFLKKLFHSFGYDFSRYIPQDFGINPIADASKFLLKTDNPTIFDVGANTGQSIEIIKNILPNATNAITIHAFEPSHKTFSLLSKKWGGDSNIFLNNFALGSRNERKTFLENYHSDMSSFLQPSSYCWGEIVEEKSVQIRTTDEYCKNQKIQNIDLLKVDTQGYDLEVLKGSKLLLESNSIKMVLMEIIFSDMYTNLPAYDEIFKFMRLNNFKLVSTYKVWHQKDLQIEMNLASWTDALFINPLCVN